MFSRAVRIQVLRESYRRGVGVDRIESDIAPQRACHIHFVDPPAL
jgi:hypothetical protein